MALDVKQYMTALAKEAGATDEQLQVVLQVVGHEKVSKQLGDDVMRHSDYSREMDKLREQEGKLARQQKEWETWYNTDALPAFNRAQANASRLKQFEETYGSLDGSDDGRRPNGAPTGDFITKKDAETYMRTLEQNMLQVTKKAVGYASKHLHEFGTPMDVEALERIAIERKLNIDQAYEELTRDSRAHLTESQKQAADKKRQDDLDAAREEGRREVRTQLRVPIDTAPKTPHPFFDRPKGEDAAKATDRVLRDDFVQTYNEAAIAPPPRQ